MTELAVGITGAMALFVVYLLCRDGRQPYEREPDPVDRKVAEVQGPGEYACEVVGESHYQAELAEIAGGWSETGVTLEVKAVLWLDDRNPHDAQAVAVVIRGKRVGHLSRANAREWRAQVAAKGWAQHVIVVPARITGGWRRPGGDTGMFGVRLDVPMC